MSNDNSPSLMVDAIVEKEGKILLVKERKIHSRISGAFPEAKSIVASESKKR
jgi:hypothetical protein